MTLVAFDVADDRAEVVTDTLAYSEPGMRWVWPEEDKTLTLDRLAAVVACQGTGDFTDLWLARARTLAETARSFDEFVTAADVGVRDCWEVVQDYLDAHNRRTGASKRARSTTFLVGWSHRAGRFVAYGYASHLGWERVEVDTPFVMPTPVGARPSSLELSMLSAEAGASLPGYPSLEPGTDLVAAAKRARRTRALALPQTGRKWVVGGSLVRTVVTRDGCTTEIVHRFDDLDAPGDEFKLLVAGTLHPYAQLGPCPCGSGQRASGCHLMPPEVPCPCQSGERFGDCCRVSWADVEAQAEREGVRLPPRPSTEGA